MLEMMRNSLDPSSRSGGADLNVHGQRLDDTSYISRFNTIETLINDF